jgi:hypothetical protein
MNISKELLSEVLGIDDVKIHLGEGRYLYNSPKVEYDYTHKDGKRRISYINAYELQNKCRIWAYEQGYSFGTYLIDDKWYTVTEDNLFSNITYWHEDYSSIKLKLIDDYTSSTEPEACFKCCQWILENKDK